MSVEDDLRDEIKALREENQKLRKRLVLAEDLASQVMQEVTAIHDLIGDHLGKS